MYMHELKSLVYFSHTAKPPNFPAIWYLLLYVQEHSSVQASHVFCYLLDVCQFIIILKEEGEVLVRDVH